MSGLSCEHSWSRRTQLDLGRFTLPPVAELENRLMLSGLLQLPPPQWPSLVLFERTPVRLVPWQWVRAIPRVRGDDAW